MTADAPMEYDLFKLSGLNGNKDIECETAAVSSHVFTQEETCKSLQWAIGLELFLQLTTHGSMFNTDHPNAGPLQIS